jgi:hypothetical protein
LLWFAAHEQRQGDLALDYPPLPALDHLASLPPGRIWGLKCFPPNLNLMYGLQDVRGYDAVDPARYVELLKLACDPKQSSVSYAATQMVNPKLLDDGGELKLHPVADLLNVRYIIARKRPPGLPVLWHQDDYWILENRHALPRAFVPRTVRVVQSDEEALAFMEPVEFSPRAVVLMSAAPNVPAVMEGTAIIRYESPTRAHIDADMKTDGIVVVSDLWDSGWRAQLDGVSCPIERVDVALRGLHVSAGKHTVVMIYDPPCVRRGFQIATAGGLAWLAWAIGLLVWPLRRRRLPDAAPA